MDNLLLCRADSTLAPMEGTEVLSEIIDLDTMEVLYQSEEPFSYRGSFSLDKSAVYAVMEGEVYGGICRYDFDKQEYFPIIQTDSGKIINFQLMHH